MVAKRATVSNPVFDQLVGLGLSDSLLNSWGRANLDQALRAHAVARCVAVLDPSDLCAEDRLKILMLGKVSKHLVRTSGEVVFYVYPMFFHSNIIADGAATRVAGAGNTLH